MLTLAGKPVTVTVELDGDPDAAPAVVVGDRVDAAPGVGSGTATVAGRTATYTFPAGEGYDAPPRTFYVVFTYQLGGSDRWEVVTVDAVRRLLFDVAQLRAHDDALTADDYPDVMLEAVRDSVQYAFGEALGWFPGQREFEDTLSPEWWPETDALGLSTLSVPHGPVTGVRDLRVRANSQAGWGEPLALPEWSRRALHGRWEGAGAYNSVKVVYTAGDDFGPDLARAGMQLAAAQLHAAPVPSRATVQRDEYGSFSLSVPGSGRDRWARPFGYPEVDAVIRRLSQRPLPVL